MSLVVCSLYSKGAVLCSLLLESSRLSCSIRFSAGTGAKGAKINYFLGCFGVFSGFSETRKDKNKDIFYFEGLQGLPLWLSLCGGGGVHWVQVVGAALAILLALAKMNKIPSFGSLCRFAIGALLANMALFRVFRGILRGFSCWMWVCIACVLCVACGAFVCVSG